jgi:hypothetical protein
MGHNMKQFKSKKFSVTTNGLLCGWLVGKKSAKAFAKVHKFAFSRVTNS